MLDCIIIISNMVLVVVALIIALTPDDLSELPKFFIVACVLIYIISLTTFITSIIIGFIKICY